MAFRVPGAAREMLRRITLGLAAAGTVTADWDPATCDLRVVGVLQ